MIQVNQNNPIFYPLPLLQANPLLLELAFLMVVAAAVEEMWEKVRETNHRLAFEADRKETRGREESYVQKRAKQEAHFRAAQLHPFSLVRLLAEQRSLPR